MPNLIVYDPLFNHRAIVVKVGLAALIRLHIDGYYIAYYKTEGPIPWSYYIIHCRNCQHNFLAAMKDLNDPSRLCPICNSYAKT